ncbi:MAG TPA: serine hydrolase domain-containing protein [Candidatus Sulfomarinibacteraceae bacterium]|nr:serine hydrolase domain-containing protein [Candidatus Sulfomarinibacteraceae bacterium]
MTTVDETLHAADAVADRFLEGKHLPGVAYGIVLDGELVHSRGIGTLRVGEESPPDADSVFRIASMTKSFTAATVVSLRDEGRLSLDDPIARHVPELAGLRGPTTDSPAITIRHLLTMSSGLATDDPWGDRQQGLDLGAFSELLGGPLTFAWTPGTRFEYSNLGYGILGRLISNVAGAEYRDVVRARFLGPLGMDSTVYDSGEVPPERLAHGYVWRDGAFLEEPMDPYGALASMGGLFSSVRDLARWVGFFTDAYPPRDAPEGGPPLSRASRREMQQAQGAWWPSVLMASPDADPEVAAGGYGLGLFVQDHLRWGRLVRHSGGYPGFGSHMWWQPASGVGVIVLANHRYAPSTLLSRELMAALLSTGAMPARRIRPAAATTAARAAVERLLDRWDAEVAAGLFAMNVELDEPLERRRAEIDRLRAAHGPLRLDPDLPEESETGLHLAWWLAGERGGRVRVEIRLSPESPPRVQTLDISAVPEPGEPLRVVAAALIASVNAPAPAIPDGLDLGPVVDRTALGRVLRVVGARFAPVELGPAVAGDGLRSATWRVRGKRGERGELELTIERDPASALVTTVNLVPRSPVMPPHDD